MAILMYTGRIIGTYGYHRNGLSYKVELSVSSLTPLIFLAVSYVT